MSKNVLFAQEGIVERIEFDPNRSAHIAFVRYPESGRVQYVLAVDGLKPGDDVLATAGERPPKYFKPGYAMPLRHIPDKAVVCCVECEPGNGAQFVRSAGTYAKILNKNGTRKGYALLQLCSQELRLFNLDCMATLGRVSNAVWARINWGKAGYRRQLGWRPAVKGVSMNAVDHPHGGGTKHKRTRSPHGGGAHTKWGKPMVGFKTMPKKKLRVPVESQRILQRRPRKSKQGQIF